MRGVQFYLTIVQAVLLYGADSWVVSEKDLSKRKSFHKRAIWHMIGTHIQKLNDGEWVYTDHCKLIFKSRLFSIETYLERRRGTLWEYFNNHRKGLVEEMERMDAFRRGCTKLLWWDQEF